MQPQAIDAEAKPQSLNQAGYVEQRILAGVNRVHGLREDFSQPNKTHLTINPEPELP